RHSVAWYGRPRGRPRPQKRSAIAVHSRCRGHVLRHGWRPGKMPCCRRGRLYRETDQPRFVRGGNRTISPGVWKGCCSMNCVLIVDDKPDNLYLLRAMLRSHGFVVEEASHGAEALVKARQAAPILVISDLLMPVMDGYSLLKHWKADERLKNIPF